MGKVTVDLVSDSRAVDYPDLVYSAWLDRFYPCRLIATAGDMALIETPVGGVVRQMRIPRRIIYRRPPSPASDGGGDALEV